MTEVAKTRVRLARPAWTGSVYYVFAYCFLTIIYLCLVFIPQPDQATLHHYHLRVGDYDMLMVPLVIFFVAIWLVSFYGSLKFRAYAEMLRSTREGRALGLISAGLMVLAIYLPFTSDLGSLFRIIERGHADARPTLTIINNYIDLAIMGTALVLLATGADKLSSSVKKRAKALPQQFWVALFIAFSGLYSFFIINRPVDITAIRPYYLPNWLLLITITIPYVYFWYRGLAAAYNIYRYRKNVRGRLYKNAISSLAAGIAVAVVGSILTRMLITVSISLNRLNLTPVLSIIYGLLVVIAIGFALIALGAKRLRHIEEV